MTTRRQDTKVTRTNRGRAARAPSGRGFGGGALVEGGAWRDGYNPTKRLTVERAVWLMECYSRGMFAELMWLFAAPYMGIEKKDPVYLAIIERRVAAVRQMDWSVRVDDEDAADPRAKAQKAALEEAYGKIGNLGKAIEALEMATFRGFAHLGITPEELVIVQPWNVQRDGCAGGWRFNPGAVDCGWEALGPEMDMLPELHVTREVERPVGAVALVKWLRSNLSEKDWDAFIEVYGLPAWLIVGPPNIPADKVDAYQAAAEKIARGGSGYLPNGSSAQCADSPRAGAPFDGRLRYLNEMLVIAGTGGMLTMLAESGSGTLAGNAHADAFATLARMDAADISECFQRQFDRRALESAGLLRPGERAKAWFTLDYKSEPDVGETVQQIGALAAAGYEVDPAQVEELTGYRVRAKAVPQPGMGMGGLFNRKTAGETPASPAETRLAKAMQRDLRPVGKLIAEALKKRDWGALRKRLSGALKECGTESADAIETAMLEAGEKEWKEGENSARGAVLANTTAQVPAGNGNGGQFTGKTNPPDGKTPKKDDDKYVPNPYEPDERKWPKADFSQPKSVYQKANEERAQNAVDKLMDQKGGVVVGAMTSKKLGPIDIAYGHHNKTTGKGMGLVHCEAHGAKAVAMVPETLARGKYYHDKTEPGAYLLVRDTYVLSLKKIGGPHYTVISCYNDPEKASDYTRRGGQIENRKMLEGE